MTDKEYNIAHRDDFMTQRERDLSESNEQLDSALVKAYDDIEKLGEQFEEIYNMVLKTINLDADVYTDGEVIDIIHDNLKKWQGESDNLIKIEK